MNKFFSKWNMIIAIFAIAFIVYNVLLFIVSGFSGHSATFWISYVFMIVAFLSMLISNLILKNKTFMPKDWILGYPIWKHSFLYITIELVASIIFMIVERYNCPWQAAFFVQLVLLCLYLVFVISCFFEKKTIEEVHEKAKTATTNWRLLQYDAEAVYKRAVDTEAATVLKNLVEEIRYSDPISNDQLLGIESQIIEGIKEISRSVDLNDMDNTIACGRRTLLLLDERNEKCKILKS